MAHIDETPAPYGGGMSPAEPSRLVVIGAGMVAHRVVESLRARDGDRRWRVTVLGDEGRRPYDRIALSTVVDGGDPAALELGAPLLWSDPRIELRADDAAVAIDREARVVLTQSGARIPYDRVVLATGSSARLPAVPGSQLDGVFVIRTADDALALRAWVDERRARLGVVRGAVLGGGLLGLEAAGSLQSMGVETTVVQSSGRLMSAQLDEGGSAALRRLIEQRGIRVLTERRTRAVSGTPSGDVGGLVFTDGERLDADVVVVAVGITPRDELAVAVRARLAGTGIAFVDNWSDAALTDLRYWSIDRLHLNAFGHARVAGNVLAALGVEVPAAAHAPYAVGERLDIARPRTAEYWRQYVLPWIGRRLTGRSSGDGRTAKRPTLLPVEVLGEG